MAVDDINKLNPELLKKSKAQIQREIDERTLALHELERQELVAAKEALAKEANTHIEAATAAVKFLHENGILHEKLIAAFTRADGVFTTGNVLKPVTAESLVGGRKADGPKRKRRSRAEMAAARAAGEPARRR